MQAASGSERERSPWLSNALRAEPRMTGTSSPGKPYLLKSSRTSNSTSSSSSSSSIISTLLRKTTMAGTSTCWASRMCSRVWGLVDLVEGHVLVLLGQGGQHFGDRRRQRRLAVVDVADRAHVHMRFRSLKLLLCHECTSSSIVLSANYVRQGLHLCDALV